MVALLLLFLIDYQTAISHLLFDVDSVEAGEVVELPEVKRGRERRYKGDRVVVQHHHYVRG